MRVVHSPRYAIDIGAHVFPTAKYGAVRDRVVAAGVVEPTALLEPRAASWDDLSLVHTPEYLDKVRRGRLSPREVARLEIPWSAAIVDGFRLITGGTVAAAGLAMDDGVAAHLGGGFHHAFAAHGEGFCLFNDVAVALRALRAAGRLDRAAVLDCDVHQGNGTAGIFAGDSTVFTCSIHQEHNYPAEKPPSSLDVGLPDGLGDREYLDRLADALTAVMAFEPDLVVYLAGADPYRDDQLGGLALTQDGLRQRDRRVLRTARDSGAALAVVLAGGYARRFEDTVAIHAATVEEAAGA